LPFGLDHIVHAVRDLDAAALRFMGGLAGACSIKSAMGAVLVFDTR
jgi:hypothetical protein